MTHLVVTANEMIRHLLGVGVWLTAGVPIGAIHFLTLQWNAHLFVSGRRLLLPLAIQLVRLGLIGASLTAVGRIFGALPLLLTTAGILVTRTALVRRRLPT